MKTKTPTTPPKKKPIKLSKAQQIEIAKMKRDYKWRTDPSYRNKIRCRARDRYRRQEGVSLAPTVALDLTLHTEEFINDAGRKIAGVSIKSLSESLGYYFLSVYRWQKKGIFPKPKRKGKPASGVAVRASAFFTVSEAKSICAIMRAHQRDHHYLFSRDKKTIDLLAKI